MPKYSDEFERLWKLYPRKSAKFVASQKFELLQKKNPKEVEMLFKYIERQKWPEPRFMLHLATLINQKRYLDPENDFEDVKQKQDKIKRDQEYEKQKNNMDERLEVKEKTIEEVAESIKKRINFDLSEENLEREIRLMSSVGRNAPEGSPLWVFKKKKAKALVLLFGKEKYLEVWGKINKPFSHENRLQILNEQKNKLLKDVDK